MPEQMIKGRAERWDMRINELYLYTKLCRDNRCKGSRSKIKAPGKKQTDETKSTETLNSITQHIFDIYLLHVGAHKTFSLLFKLW